MSPTRLKSCVHTPIESRRISPAKMPSRNSQLKVVYHCVPSLYGAVPYAQQRDTPVATGTTVSIQGHEASRQQPRHTLVPSQCCARACVQRCLCAEGHVIVLREARGSVFIRALMTAWQPVPLWSPQGLCWCENSRHGSPGGVNAVAV